MLRLRHGESIVILTALMIVLAGCSPAPDPPTPPGPSEELACEVNDYPCTLGEVSDAVLDRSDELLADVKTMVEAGTNFSEALAWISDQDGVVQARADDSGVYFRVDGGVPTWLLAPQDRSLNALHPQGVVGRGTPRDADAPKKNAIVIAPFTWQWGPNDPSNNVINTLRRIGDYKDRLQDRVEVRQNNVVPPLPTVAQPSTGNVKVSDFMGWEAYDVIYVSSHGGLRDDEGGDCGFFEWCLVSVTSGERVLDCKTGKVLYGDREGIRCTAIIGITGTFLTLTSEFFRNEYGLFKAGLDEAVIFIDSCHSYNNSTLANQLGGGSSSFFGWDSSVGCSFGATVTSNLFQFLSNGLTAEEAFDEINDRGIDPAGGPELELSSSGEDLRIRELPSLRHRTSGVALEEGAVLFIEGTPGDGVNDELIFVVDVMGIREGGSGPVSVQGDASEFNVRFLVDGVEVGADNVGNPVRGESVQVDEFTYRLTLRTALGFDVPEGGKEVEVEALIDPLLEGGRTFHRVERVMLNPRCFWQIEVVGSSRDGVYRGGFATFSRDAQAGLIVQLAGELGNPPLIGLIQLSDAPSVGQVGGYTLGLGDVGDGLSTITFIDGVHPPGLVTGDGSEVLDDGNPPEVIDHLPGPSVFDLITNRDHQSGGVYRILC
jgi:hypothetical protein